MIDTHSHLLPFTDDGCTSYEDSLACAKQLVAAGYTHAFCTPHVWPNLPHNHPAEIARRVADLQEHLNRAHVPLTLHPGGELNLRPETLSLTRADVITYDLAGKVCLFDVWADTLPDFFEPAVAHLQSLGLTVIMAHPERTGFLQRQPQLLTRLQELGLLFQGNLQCFSDPDEAPTRRTADLFLREGRYFMLGSDTHNPKGLPCRLDGLQRAAALVGPDEFHRLTHTNPLQLLA